ncbi:MAG: TetR/AcrR family transcriptional regulator [Burkholderiaceae bacterium]
MRRPDPPEERLMPERRSRGRPRKSADAPDDGNRRQALLQAAAQLFRQQGFAATRTRDIAAAAGMQSGSPFYHFENKQVMLGAVMVEGMQRALARQKAALEQAGLPPCADAAGARERLRVLVRTHFDVLLGPDSAFIPVMLYEWRSLTPAQRDAVDQLRRDYEAMWVLPLRTLHAAGELAGDPALARLMIFGALNWAVQWYDPRRRATLDDLTDTAINLFLKQPA